MRVKYSLAAFRQAVRRGEDLRRLPLKPMRHVIAGTAGHIDHGKSALVKALTHEDPDRLKEEKLRGITIDLGFAHLDLGDLQVGFVDVPGHEKFVKNMLAGVGGIDFVLLVVAADESVMPQTREHFDICRLLGIPAGAVVITKIDLVEDDLVELVREEVRDLTAGSFLEGADIVPISARTGEGLNVLIEAIRRLARESPRRPSNRPLRLPIDRAFTMRGFGTVVTGTLSSGRINKDQEVELIPGGLVSRVRGIQVHRTRSEFAVAGQRTAVNLQGVDLGQVHRGMVITEPRRFRSTQLLDVRLSLLASAPHPLKNLVKVRFHHATSEVLARVALLGRDSVEPGNSAFAQLRLDYPAFCLHGDAFILRQFSPPVTIGGGRILNPCPVKHRSTEREVVDSLRQLEGESLMDKIPVLLKMQRERAVSLGSLDGLLNLEESEIRSACDSLADRGDLVMIKGAAPALMLPATLSRLQAETLAQIESYYEQNPLQKGIPREELRRRVYDGLPQEVFRSSLEDLAAASKVSLHEDVVSLHGREVQLSPEGERVRSQIEEVLQRSPFQPPILSELQQSVGGNPDEVRRIYFWMLKERILVRISEDLAYHRETLEEIKRTIRTRFAPGSRFGVAEFKTLFDLTRKHAIPLLEYLDRERFTRRQGNDRILL